MYAVVEKGSAPKRQIAQSQVLPPVSSSSSATALSNAKSLSGSTDSISVGQSVFRFMVHLLYCLTYIVGRDDYRAYSRGKRDAIPLHVTYVQLNARSIACSTSMAR